MVVEELTQIHDVVAANGAVVDYDIPGPEGDSVPLCFVRDYVGRMDCRCAITFLTSNLFFGSASPLAPALETLVLGGASVISTSAMVGNENVENGTLLRYFGWR